MKAKIYFISLIIIALCFDTFGQSTLLLPNSTSFKNSVGIGPTAPRGVFDVNLVGDIYLTNVTSSGTTQSLFLPGHIFLAPYAASNVSYLQARRQNNTGDTELQLRTSNAGSLNDAIRINSLGYVGIGLTSPNAPLHMKSKVNSVTFKIENSDYTHNNLEIGEDMSNNAYLKLNNNINEQLVRLGPTSQFNSLTASGTIYSPSATFPTLNSDNLTTDNISIGGVYSVNSTAPLAPLFVAKEKSSGSVAIFENTSPYGDGITIRIKANGGGVVYGSDSDFIKFSHWNPTTNNYYTNGVIEGYRYADWLNNYSVYNLCDLHDMLGIPDGLISLIAAYANAQAVGACMDDGVRYKSTGADYAEYLPKEDPKSKILPASVVGVKNGKISYKTEGADQVMAISTRAVVLGNMPQPDKKDEYETVAFIGQVHVWVIGEVKSGDFIVASGKNNGTAVAISPEKLEINDIPNIVGRAWESKNLPINLVNTVVGVKTSEVFEILKKESAKTKALEASVADLKNEFTSLKNSLHLSSNK